jgi:hypothetical protein
MDVYHAQYGLKGTLNSGGPGLSGKPDGEAASDPIADIGV